MLESPNILDIGFRSVTQSDLPMLKSWIAQPHWQEWWGKPETEIDYIQDMLDGCDTTEPYIFTIKGLDAGYIQVWTIKDQMLEPWLSQEPWITMVSVDSVGVDLTLAQSNMVSKGLGTAVLSAFVKILRARGHKNILIDPDQANKRAVKCYEKAGFIPIKDLIGKTGNSLIMAHHNNKESIS